MQCGSTEESGEVGDGGVKTDNFFVPLMSNNNKVVNQHLTAKVKNNKNTANWVPLDHFNGTRESVNDRSTLVKFSHDTRKLRLAISEKRYKHTAFLIFNKDGSFRTTNSY